jgi:hypothetical protein
VKREKRRAKGGRAETKLKLTEYLVVTNASKRKWTAKDVIRHYHQREREEFSFKDGKQSLPMAKMPTQKMMANQMHVQMVALAQLIMQLFARHFLPHAGRYGPTCKTIREKVIAVGGKNQRESRGSAGTDLLRAAMAQVHGPTTESQALPQPTP